MKTRLVIKQQQQFYVKSGLSFDTHALMVLLGYMERHPPTSELNSHR